MKLTQNEWKLLIVLVLALGGGAIVRSYRQHSPPGDQATIGLPKH